MRKERRKVNNQLTVEVVRHTWPSLWIARDGDGQVRGELSELRRLAKILGNVAADLEMATR